MPIEIRGGEEILKKLFSMGAQGQAAVAQAVMQTGEAAAAYARKKAPMGASAGKGGHLAQNIHSQFEQNESEYTAIVTSEAPYSQYVEFGTGWPVGQNVFTQVTTKTGKTYTIKGWIAPIGHDGEGNQSFRVVQGMAPRPFMKPAKDFAMRSLKTRLAAAYKRLINNG